MASIQRPSGPVDIAVLAFSDPNSESVVATAIDDAVQTGAARVLDALWIRKDSNGEVSVIDVDDESEARELLGFPTDLPGLLGEDDVHEIAADLPAGSSAAVIAWENTWAARIGVAVREVGGQMLAHERIPSEAVWEILDLLDAQPPDSGRS